VDYFTENHNSNVNSDSTEIKLAIGSSTTP